VFSCGKLRNVGEDIRDNAQGNVLVGKVVSAGDRLCVVFKDSGLSQYEFCKRTGVARSMFGYIMNGSRQMMRRYAEKIEKVYGIGADWLLYGREECKDYPCDDEMISFLKSNPQARKKVREMMKENQKGTEKHKE